MKVFQVTYTRYFIDGDFDERKAFFTRKEWSPRDEQELKQRTMRSDGRVCMVSIEEIEELQETTSNEKIRGFQWPNRVREGHSLYQSDEGV